MIIIIGYGVLGQPVQLPWVLINSECNFLCPVPRTTCERKVGEGSLVYSYSTL